MHQERSHNESFSSNIRESHGDFNLKIEIDQSSSFDHNLFDPIPSHCSSNFPYLNENNLTKVSKTPPELELADRLAHLYDNEGNNNDTNDNNKDDNNNTKRRHGSDDSCPEPGTSRQSFSNSSYSTYLHADSPRSNLSSTFGNSSFHIRTESSFLTESYEIRSDQVGSIDGFDSDEDLSPTDRSNTGSDNETHHQFKFTKKHNNSNNNNNYTMYNRGLVLTKFQFGVESVDETNSSRHNHSQEIVDGIEDPNPNPNPIQEQPYSPLRAPRPTAVTIIKASHSSSENDNDKDDTQIFTFQLKTEEEAELDDTLWNGVVFQKVSKAA